MKKVDIIIIGAGPAGISAGIYAKMDNANYILIEKNKPCWFLEESINSHYFTDGFTGIKNKTTGTDLRKMLTNHYKRLGGKCIKDTVISIKKINGGFNIKTKKQDYISKVVIITCGTSPKDIDIQGLKKFKNQIHHFCTIDGKQYIGKDVVVIGGRNSGAAAASYLHDIGCKVSLVEIQDKLQCKEKYQAKLKKRGIKIYTSAITKEFAGKNSKLEEILINQKGKDIKIPTSAVFLYIGIKPAIDFCNIKIDTNYDGYLIVNSENQTSCKGVYAAGDVTTKLKQAITACGDGANAYYHANKMLSDLNNNKLKYERR